MNCTTTAARPPLVCDVDDDALERKSVVDLVREEGFHVDSFESAEGFLGRTRVEPPACLILDHVLPGMSGLELHEELARTGVDLPTILITGHDDVSTCVRAMKAGAADVFGKPYDDGELLDAVRRAVSWRFPVPTAGPAPGIGGIGGAGAALRGVLQQIELVAGPERA